MSVDRRKFLKLAGASTLIGLGGRKALEALPALAQGPAPAEYERPLEAKRWAMVIDLRRWTKEDAAACIRACHEAHNVPSLPDPDEEIRWMWTDDFEHAFPTQENHYLAERFEQLPIPMLCNHCDNPPCTRVCPTQATWKRKQDGVVMMDWHRCIGCRYCVAACPYGSRTFNWRDPRPYIEDIRADYPTRERGVVEKCTFCEERLARGQLPACVEACPSGAMTFGDLQEVGSPVRRLLEENFAIRRKPGLGTQPEVYYLV
jgi:Fe-S-cluster-containing dehydrogenase component